MILVVDDDAPIRRLMCNLLRQFGFETVAVGSGREALASVRSQAPALILLDRNMPGLSGDEVLEELRAGGEALAAIPVIILSGEPIEPSDLERLGAIAAVLKPFDIADLIDKIRRHL
jgi:CheY-like chemotaxis protein